MHGHKYTLTLKKAVMQTHNFLSQQCPSAVSFIGVPSYYTNWITSSYSFSISTTRTVSHRFSVSYLHGWMQISRFLHMYPIPLKLGTEKKSMTYVWRKKIKVCGHAASAKYMVSHFTEQLEQMNHQAIPQVFKSISAHRRSVSCLVCVVHLNRHVKKYVMWKVCLLKCASLIMVFPSISVSPPTPFTLPHPLSWRPYLFGAGCFAIKTPWWVLLLPSLAPSAACNCILRHSTPPSLPLICLLVYFQHIPQSLCSHSSGEKNPKEECFLFSHLFCAFFFFSNPSIFLCVELL